MGQKQPQSYLCVFDHLDLVFVELFRLGVLHGDSDSGDGVIVGSTLEGGEDGQVDSVLEVVGNFLAESVRSAVA